MTVIVIVSVMEFSLNVFKINRQYSDGYLAGNTVITVTINKVMKLYSYSSVSQAQLPKKVKLAQL